MYSVKEIYYTIQGEGFYTGRSAVFLRFSGCNLWSGLEKDRSNAICQFCDTDFWGMDGDNGGRYTAEQLAEVCYSLWPTNGQTTPFIVCTGGEPLLQLDAQLIDCLHQKGFYIAIETNGTLPIPEQIDWSCVSPKANAEFAVKKGNELKIVFPQAGLNIEDFEGLDFDHYFLQPMDNQDLDQNIKLCISICTQRPKWKLSLQTHKIIGIP